MFLINYANKERHFSHAAVTTAYQSFYCAVIGAVVNIMLFSKKKLNFNVGVGIGLALYVISEIVNMFVLKLHSRHVWKLFVLALCNICICAYMNYDAELMITKRNNQYTVNDWFVGFVHLFTDWTFRFWMDLFVNKDYKDGAQGIEDDLDAERK